jgi:hypothetical protein
MQKSFGQEDIETNEPAGPIDDGELNPAQCNGAVWRNPASLDAITVTTICAGRPLHSAE